VSTSAYERAGTSAPVSRRPEERTPPAGQGDVYLQVQASPEFQEIRRRYRDFVFPMSVVFLVWYLAYVVASVFARDLMGRRVAGEFNVAFVFGLAQFVTTFLITWLYARNAGRKRDRAALDLRWETQERFR
jgi:uncharacterized membrane protein (DUF485 family)